MELLLRKNATINVVNKGRCSALHVAVNKQHAACVKVLIKYNCDINIQVRSAFTHMITLINFGSLLISWRELGTAYYITLIIQYFLV